MITATMKHTSFQFPCGELQVQILDDRSIYDKDMSFDLTWEFESTSEVMELLLLRDAMERHGFDLGDVHIPYFPFARQDKVHGKGEAISVFVMAKIVNALNATRVIITDPHSDVTPVLLNRCTVIEQHEVFLNTCDLWAFKDRQPILVSPDGGALKKIYKLAKRVQWEVLECSKRRDVSTGEITGVHVPEDDLHRQDCVIVDDICDGGRTFVELAKVLKASNCGTITLFVTHGFFTKGLGVFDGLIDVIYTRKGRVK